MHLRHTRIGLAIAAAALTLAGCGSPAPATPSAAGGPLVVTSTDVYGSIAQAVGGDRIRLTSLITDPAADPHSYESTPTDAATVADAAIVVFNGGGYDEFVRKLVDAGAGRQKVIEIAELAGLVPKAAPGSAAEFNEHFWYSLPTMQRLATQMATDLGTADPANAGTYTANATAFNGRLGELITRAKAIGAAGPGARVAVTEPVPGYLIETAGLVNATPEEFTTAIEEDTDPPAAVLTRTLALFTNDPVKALILNAQTQTPTTDQVAQAAKSARVPIVEMTETLPAGTTEYAVWIGSQIDALAGALTQSRTP